MTALRVFGVVLGLWLMLGSYLFGAWSAFREWGVVGAICLLIGMAYILLPEEKNR